MSILIPVVLSGLATLVALDGKANAVPSHPAALYAEAMTATFAALSPKVKLTYAFDEAAQTLTVTGQLSQVIPLRKIKLVADLLNQDFVTAMKNSIDLDALSGIGVDTVFELVDRNRTPIEA